MNALENIQNEAKVIVEQLADKQINDMKERYNGFLEWMNVGGNALMGNYDNKVDMYQSTHKYIYMTHV
jgi:predicted choloylglycine hydrolase